MDRVGDVLRDFGAAFAVITIEVLPTDALIPGNSPAVRMLS
jgi:hypothetical protein